MKRLLTIAIVIFAFASSCSRGPSPNPNVILVTIDTLRADRVGCYGARNVSTPMMDALAAGGTRYDQVVAPTPLTLPSHSSIFTGRIPPAHLVRHNVLFELPGTERTLAESFKAAGYRTGAVLAATVLNAEYGLDQGFDYYDDIPLGGSEKERSLERRADEVVKLALSWLQQGDGRPVFLWIHFYDPHYPYAPTEPFRSRLRDPYNGEVAAVDAALNSLVGELERTGLPARDTLLAITSDHGESLGEHGEKTHGFFAYQATLRVPLILFGPGRIPAGEVVYAPVGLIDIAPTLLNLAGLEMPADLDGRDLFDPSGNPVEQQKRMLYFESQAPLLDHGWAPLTGFRRDDLTFIDAPRPEIYDLAEDPGETNNIAPERADEVVRFREELKTVISLRKGGDASEASRLASDEEAEALRSLGYLAGTTGGDVGSEVDTSLLPDPKDRVQEMRTTFEALALLGEGKPSDAISALNDAIKRDPSNITATVLLAQVLASSGRPGEAVATVDSALHRFENGGLTSAVRGQLLMMRGRYLHLEGRYEEAVASLTAARREIPLNRESMLVLVEAEFASKQPADALDVLNELLQKSRDNTALLMQTAELAWRYGHVEQARILVDRVLAIEPSHPGARSLSARIG